MLSRKPSYKLLIIGDGELENEIKQIIGSLGLKRNTIMLRSTNNIADYYSAIDGLVMPSIYEGLPFVGIEAQFADLPCYFSNTITKELEISKNCHFLSINRREDANKWVEEIEATIRGGNHLLVNSNKYNLNEQAKKLIKLYRGSQGEDNEK